MGLIRHLSFLPRGVSFTTQRGESFVILRFGIFLVSIIWISVKITLTKSYVQPEITLTCNLICVLLG